MAKLVSLPEIIQNIYVKLEESGQGGSGTGGNCSSNITVDTSTNKGTLNISDGSVLSTQVLNVEDTPKAGRVTLTDKDNNSISFDAVALTHLESNYYDKTTVDNKLSGLVLDSYDDTELKNRVTVLENKVDNDTIYDDSAITARVEALENKVDNDTIYDDTELSNRVTTLENKVSNMVTYADLAYLVMDNNVYDFTEDTQDINQLISNKYKGSPTTTLTVDDLNFVEHDRREVLNEYYEKILIITYEAIAVNVNITFKDGSSININRMGFYKTTEENLGSEYIYVPLKNGVKIQRTNSSVPAYVDTGLTKNGNYAFEASGYTTNGKVSVLVGSYDSNTDRTTARLLGTSNKLQSMWSANNEITNTESGIDFNLSFEYEQKANSISINGYTKTFTNHNTSQTTNTPIYLFNESATGDYDNGVLIYAGIGEYVYPDGENPYGESYNKYFKYFIPCKDTRTNEVVLIDVASYQRIYDGYFDESDYIEDLKNGNIPEEKIYRPTNGILVEA